jgi:biotin carboxyl carrier protein
MEKTYKIKVNDTYNYSIDANTIKNLDVIQNNDNQFHVVANTKSFMIDVLQSDFQKKKYKISINGNSYSIEIKDELDQLIKELGLTINGKQKDSNVKAPMPGIILEIQVDKGQEVVEGDTLLVLEAMKMENMLTAPKDGIIRSINVKKGVTVEKGELLIEME